MSGSGRRGTGPALRQDTVTIRSGALTFEVARAGRGASLVYLPSVLDGPAGSWPPLALRLAERRRVTRPVLLDPASADGLLDLVLAHDELLEVLARGPADLVGHADAGMLAAEIAALCPSRVRRLILLAPLGLWRDDAPSADTLILPPAELADVLWADPDGAAAQAWSTWPEDEDAQAATQIERTQRRAAAARFLWPIPDRGLGRRLHRVRAPAVVIWGDADRANPPLYAGLWASGLPRGRVVTVPGGHMVAHESPELVAGVIEAFLAEPAGAVRPGDGSGARPDLGAAPPKIDGIGARR